MTFTVSPIVEGHGDVAALPLLLRRMNPTISISRPIRFPRSKLVKPDELARAIRIARSNIQDTGLILLVLDADDDCAATLGPKLLQDMKGCNCGTDCFCAVAVREFEAWILGGHPEFVVDDADSTGNLKNRLRDHFGVYSETVDQPKLTAGIDLELLTVRSRSFRHLARLVASLPQ